MKQQRLPDNQDNSCGSYSYDLVHTFINFRELKLANFVANFQTRMVENASVINATYITTFQKNNSLLNQ